MIRLKIEKYYYPELYAAVEWLMKYYQSQGENGEKNILQQLTTPVTEEEKKAVPAEEVQKGENAVDKYIRAKRIVAPAFEESALRGSGNLVSRLAPSWKDYLQGRLVEMTAKLLRNIPQETTKRSESRELRSLNKTATDRAQKRAEERNGLTSEEYQRLALHDRYQRLIEALRTFERESFNTLVAVANPYTAPEIARDFKSLAGIAYHAKVKTVVDIQPGRGSMIDTLRAAVNVLKEKYGSAYREKVFEAGERMMMDAESGVGSRMPVALGKPLMRLPVRTTIQRLVLEQRFDYMSSNDSVMEKRPGLLILSGADLTIPEGPILLPPLQENGKSKILVYGPMMAVGDERLPEHGAIYTRQSGLMERGEYEILSAIEKAKKEERRRLIAEKVLPPADWVIASQAAYELPWDAVFWLYDKLDPLATRIEKGEFGENSKGVALNWMEQFFEPATLGKEIYLARDFHKGVPVNLLLEIEAIAKEAKERFLLNAVNVGQGAYYGNMNTPFDYMHLFELLRNEANIRGQFHLVPVNPGELFRQQIIDKFSGLLVDAPTVIASSIDRSKLGPEVVLVGYNVLTNVDDVKLDGTAVESIGKFELPRTSLLCGVFSLGRTFKARPGTYNTDFFITAEDGHLRKIRVSLPSWADLREKTPGGKLIMDLRVYPRRPDLADQLPTEEEERQAGPGHYTLPEIRERMASTVHSQLRDLLKEMNDQQPESLPAEEIEARVRQLIMSMPGADESTLADEEGRAELRAGPERQEEITGFEQRVPPVDLGAALDAVKGTKLSLDVGQIRKEARAMGVEDVLVNRIMDFAADPEVLRALGIDPATIPQLAGSRILVHDGFNDAALAEFARSGKAKNTFVAIANVIGSDAKRAQEFLKRNGLRGGVSNASVENVLDAKLKGEGRNLTRRVATQISGVHELDSRTYGQLLTGSIDLGVIVVTERAIAGIGRNLSAAEIISASFDAAQAIDQST